MADTLKSALIGGVAGLVSAVVTYFSTRARLRLDLAAEYDKQLQESRLAAYTKLWLMLEPLARYGRDGPVTYGDLQTISTDTRKWYFETGGIYLTRRSRGPYFRWKKLMQPHLDEARRTAIPPERSLPTPVMDEIIEAASTLRTSLSDDIGTKRLSRL